LPFRGEGKEEEGKEEEGKVRAISRSDANYADVSQLGFHQTRGDTRGREPKGAG